MGKAIFETSDELYMFEDYSTLMQALGLGEEIVVNNGMADLKIWMDKDYNILALNNNFKDLPPYNYNNEMTFKNVILGVIPQLKEQRPREFNNFASRWEELKTIVNDTVGLNRYKDSERCPNKKDRLGAPSGFFLED